MKSYPVIKVITASHTDTRASDKYNKTLSLKRGLAAKTYLVTKGINPNRIRIEYYGKSRLVNKCTDGVPCSEDDQQLNRRTEFEVILNGVNLNQLDCN
jgi:outer membrane protein OmpA-like peptidoglycan-associated protein